MQIYRQLIQDCVSPANVDKKSDADADRRKRNVYDFKLLKKFTRGSLKKSNIFDKTNVDYVDSVSDTSLVNRFPRARSWNFTFTLTATDLLRVAITF